MKKNETPHGSPPNLGCHWSYSTSAFGQAGWALVEYDQWHPKSVAAPKPWATVTPGWSARKGSAEESWIDRFGVHPTAPPSAYACDAATAFLAAISSAFWRIRSAKRGI